MTGARNFFRVISVTFGALGGSFFRALGGFSDLGGFLRFGGGFTFSNIRVVLDVQRLIISTDT